MKGNKFLAAVLAASMAFSMVPVTALSTWAAAQDITVYNEGTTTEVADSTSIGDVTYATATKPKVTISTGMTNATLGAAFENVFGTTDATQNVNVAIDDSKTVAPSASVNLSSKTSSVDYGSLSGDFSYTNNSVSPATTNTYSFKAEANKLADAQAGADVYADLTKKFLEAYVTDANADESDYQTALASLKTNAATSGSGNAINTLTTVANYAASYASISFDTALKDDVVTVTATAKNAADVTVATGTATFSIIPSADTATLPTVASTTGHFVGDIDDFGDVSAEYSEIEKFYAAQGLTVKSVKLASYTAATHSAEGKIVVNLTLSNGTKDQDYTNVAFNTIHGVSEIKAEAEKAINDKVASLQKNTKKNITGTAIVSKDEIADKLNKQFAVALGGTSSVGTSDTLSSTDLNSKYSANSVMADIMAGFVAGIGARDSVISTSISDYKAATATEDGYVKGTVTINYDYTDYKESGLRVQASSGTTYEGSDLTANSNLDEYQSTTDFEITLSKLNAVSAKTLGNLVSKEEYYASSKQTTGGTAVYKITTPNKAESLDGKYEKNSTETYKYKNKITLGVTFNPSGANSYTVQWASSDPSIATVAANDDTATAVVTGVNGGKATITASLVDADGKVLSKKSKVVTVDGFQFDDVQDASEFYYDHVYNLYDDKIVAGTSSTTFSPKKAVTRAEFVQMLFAASGKTVTAKSKFTDVASTAWYADAVTWAVDNNITAGTDTNTFSPNKTITRAEAMTMLYAAYGQGKTYNATHSFTDVKDNAYYKEAVNWAVKKGITAGTTGTTFGSNDPCNRGQAATFIDIAR